MAINASIKYFSADDGTRLFYQHWIPGSPRALLIYVHDLGDHIGRHGFLTKYFVEKNFAVALYDQRGHGKSGGRKGDARKFGDFVCDLSSFIHFSRAAAPENTPIFLIGAGVGGQFIINLLVPAWHAVSWGGSHPGKIEGFVTMGASIEPLSQTAKWKTRLNEKLVRFFPSLRVGTDINPYDIVKNANIAESFQNDPLVNQKISLRLKKELLDNTQLIMAMASRIQIPALMQHGKEDRITSAEGTKHFFLRLPSPAKRMHLYDECFHDLTNESLRYQILDDTKKWLEDIISTRLKESHTKENPCELLPMPL